MNIFKIYKNKITDILSDIVNIENIVIDPKKYEIFTIEPCKEKKHGDLATNAAMIFAKDFKLKPIALAYKIKDILEKDKNIDKIDIAGPGFINIFYNNRLWHKFLEDILSSEEIILPNLGLGEKVNLEYASPNPTGPMHVGHVRGAIYGDVLANLLQKTGYDVTREYYINDAGEQIKTLVKSAFLRYLEILGEKIEISEGLYPGEYLIEIAKKMEKKFGNNLKKLTEGEYMPLIRDFVLDEMMKIIKSDLKLLGIKHNVFTSEKKQLHDTNQIPKAIKILEDQSLIYRGIIEPPKGKKSNKSKPVEQLLFKSTNFGDDSDRVIQKSDGNYSYFASDIAYVLDKLERGFTKMIIPLGFDHCGYVKRITAAAKALSNNGADLKIILCQMVKFVKDGQPLKMSKRSGNFVSSYDLVKEVGPEVIRFTMLTRKNDAPFDFDLFKVIEQSKDNPVFYVNYAYARCNSVLKNVNHEMPNLINKDKLIIEHELFKNLNHDLEIDLIKKISNYEKIITISAQNYEPHRIAFYLTELASIFHNYYHEGKRDDKLRFIVKDVNITKARIYLIIAIMKIIKNALDIFNIKVMEEM